MNELSGVRSEAHRRGVRSSTALEEGVDATISQEGFHFSMAMQKLLVGSVRLVAGRRRDLTRIVEFEGEEVATHTMHRDAEGMRGVTETLYRTADGRLMVYVENWSKRDEEGIVYSLLEVTGVDLQKGGRFEKLGEGAWAWLRR